MRASTAFLAATLITLALAPAAAAEPLYHVLSKGETIYSVARDYKVTPEAILKANAIADPTRLKAGQRLVIPRGHLVQKGETLFSIAKSYSVSVDDLRAANKLGPKDVIVAGQLLVLPSTAMAEDASPSAQAAARPASQGSASKGKDKAVPDYAPKSPAAPSKASPAAPLKADEASNFPPAVKTSDKAVDKGLALPCSGEARYLDGKIDGIMILTERGVGAVAVTGGKVVSAGPFRGYGQVVVVQSRNGYIYFYGGNDSIAVKVGDAVSVGQELGKVGWDAKVGSAAAYFFVFKGGQSLDPAKAPRG